MTVRTPIAYLPVDTLSPEALQSALAEQQNRLNELPSGLLPAQQMSTLANRAQVLAGRLEGTTDEEELDEIRHAIAELLFMGE